MPARYHPSNCAKHGAVPPDANEYSRYQMISYASETNPTAADKTKPSSKETTAVSPGVSVCGRLTASAFWDGARASSISAATATPPLMSAASLTEPVSPNSRMINATAAKQ